MTKYKLIKIDKILFNDAYSLQKILQEKVLSNNEEQYILALSHNNVITTGKRGFLDNLKYDNDFYRNKDIDLVVTDRGGLATFHGDGQLVMYFILNLLDLKLGVKNFVSKVEDAIIKTLSYFKINAKQIEGYRGVFVGNDKIAAVGMQVKHNVTSHGIALNISTDLEMFDLFKPCGLTDKGVTSIKKEINKDISFDEVLSVLVENISTILGENIERR